MTRTKRFVTEPSRSPLQSRAGVLLHLIFPDLRRPAASSKRNQTRVRSVAAAANSAHSSTPGPGCASGQQLDRDRAKSAGLARSCSPTLAGCSSSQQQQLPSSLLHLCSLDADDIGGLSDLLDDDEEADQLVLQEGQPAAAAAAAGEHAAASAAPAVQQQQDQVSAPDGRSSGQAAAEQHAAVDGTAYIVERPAPAAAAAAAGPDDADGYTAVDKILEQLSVDVMLDQQYLLEQEQRSQRHSPAGAATAGGSSAAYHASSSSRARVGMPYPTGPAAGVSPPAAAAAAGSAGAAITPGGSHQVPVSMAEQQQAADAGGAPIPVGKEQQQQQQHGAVFGDQSDSIPQAWHLQHSFSAPVPSTHAGADAAAGDQTHHVSNNMLHDSSDRPFSFQDLLMSNDPAASSVNTSMGPPSSYDHHQPQQQQQQGWPPYHQSPMPHLHSTHSAPLPLATPAMPHHPHSHPSYAPASFPPRQQQQQHLQHGMPPHTLGGYRPTTQPPIPFYQPQHQPHHPHHQQQQQMYPPQHVSAFPGQSAGQYAAAGPALRHSVSSHQAELEALKQQIAEEKRRRKERKQLKKMRKIMMQQQQQQQQQGLAQQVLYAASSQQPLPLPPPPPGPNAAGTSPRPRALPHAPWPPAAAAAAAAAAPHPQQQQRRYPGMQGDAAGPYGGPYHSSSIGRDGAGSPQGAAAAAAAAAAARQHAVAQSLRQLAHKSEQMHRAGSGHAAAAARELPPHTDRRSLTPSGGGSNPAGGRYGSYSNSSSRPPMPHAMHEADAYMRSSSGNNSSSMAGLPPDRAAAGPQGQLAAAAGGAMVLDLQHSDAQQRYNTHQQQVLAHARSGSFHRGSGEFSDRSSMAAAAPNAAADHCDDAPTGVAGWMHGNAAAAAAAAAGSSPPVGRSLMGLDLRNAESAKQSAANHRSSADAVMRPSGRDVLAAAGAAAHPPRASSADATYQVDIRMSDAAAFQQHSAGHISSSTKLLSQAATAGNATAAGEAAAGAAAASPVSTTSSSGRKRSWQQAAADATTSSGHHLGHDDAVRPQVGRINSSDRLQAMSCGQQPDHNQQQQQQPQQRQQRLLQLPFNGPDVAERRPLVTTEAPAVTKPAHHQQLPAASNQAEAAGIGSDAAIAAAAASVDPGATAEACNDPAAAAAAAVGLGSPDISSMCTSSDNNAFHRPKSLGPRAAKAPRGADSGSASSSSRAHGEAAGLTSPGLSSGPGRQQSFSKATAAAAAAAAAAVVGGGGGSGDLSGYLGGFGNPGVYRTSSGKVLRMLTHPVTGKPLLLGPAVDAKSSRLGNTSLGAPAPQLFGMDLQSSHLNSMPAAYPHTPGPPANYAPSPTAAVSYSPAGFVPNPSGLAPAAAGAGVLGLGSPTMSSTHGRQRLRRDNIGGYGGVAGLGSSALSGVDGLAIGGAAGYAAGPTAGYGLSLAGNPADAMQLQPGMHEAAGQHEDSGVYAGMGAVAAAGLGIEGGMSHTNVHPAAAAAGAPALWGQQLPLQQQQQLGFDDDGLVSFEQLQHFELQPVQLFGGAAPMDFTPGVSQGMAAMPGLDFE